LKNSLHKHIVAFFSKELRLILELSGGFSSEFIGVESDYNWGRFFELLKKHRLTRHVILNESAKEILPIKVYNKLKDVSIEESSKSLLYAGELLEIHKGLKQHKIPHLFFKGTLLSIDLYANLAQRRFNDIDLLVDIDQLEKTLAVLKFLDYELFGVEVSMTEKQKKINYNISHHYQLKHKSKAVNVELHWNLTNPKSFASLKTKELLGSHSKVKLQGIDIPYISRVNNIVFLAAHGMVHQWYRLFWLKDFTKLLQNTSKEDINRALVLAERTKLKEAFTLSCITAHILYGIDLPSFCKVKKKYFKKIRIVLLSIATTELKQQGLIGKMRFVFYRIGLKKDLKYYFDLIYRLRTHYTDWSLMKLPDYMFFLYYLLRPVFLLLKVFRKK